MREGRTVMRILSLLSGWPRLYLALGTLALLAIPLAVLVVEKRSDARYFLLYRVLGLEKQHNPQNVRLDDDRILARLEDASVRAELTARYGGPLNERSFRNALDEARAAGCEDGPILDAFGVVPCGAVALSTAAPREEDARPELPSHSVVFAALREDGRVALDIAVENTAKIDGITVVPESSSRLHTVPAAADYCYAENFEVLKGAFYFTQHQSAYDTDYWRPRANWEGDSSPGVLRLNAPFFHDFNHMDGIGYIQPMAGMVMGHWQMNYAPSAMRAVLAEVFPYADDFVEGNREDGFGFQGPNFFSAGRPDLREGRLRLRIRGDGFSAAGQDLALLLARASPEVLKALPDRERYNYAYIGAAHRLTAGTNLERGGWVTMDAALQARAESWNFLLGWQERADRVNDGVDFFRFHEPVGQFLKDVNLNLGLIMAFGGVDDVGVEGSLEVDEMELCMPNESVLSNHAGARMTHAPASQYGSAERVVDGLTGTGRPAFFAPFTGDEDFFEFRFDEPIRLEYLQFSQTYVFPIRKVQLYVQTERDGEWLEHQELHLPRPRTGVPGNFLTMTRRIDTEAVVGLRIEMVEGYNSALFGLIEISAFSPDFVAGRRAERFHTTAEVDRAALESGELRVIYYAGEIPVHSEEVDVSAILQMLDRTYDVIEISGTSAGIKVLAR